VKIETHIDAFLEMMAAERGASDNTLAAYTRDLEGWNAALSKTGKSILTCGTGALEAVLSRWAKAGLAPSTAARKLSALKQYCLFAQMDGLRKDNPAHSLRGPKQGRSYAGGLRVSELVSLKLSTAARVIHADATPCLTIRGKGDKERLVPLTGAAIRAIGDWLAVREQSLPNSAIAS